MLFVADVYGRAVDRVAYPLFGGRRRERWRKRRRRWAEPQLRQSKLLRGRAATRQRQQP